MTLTLLQSEEPIDVVSDPEVSGAWAKLMDVRGQIGDAEREVADVSAEIAEARVSTTQRAAEALLDGENFEGIVADQLHQKYAAASARLPVLRRADEMQHMVYKQAVVNASRQICAGLKNRHRRIVNDTAGALVELGKALEQEINFRDELNVGGVHFAGILVAMPLSALGDPRDRDSRTAAWLREAVERDLIDKSIIPNDWWQRWQ